MKTSNKNILSLFAFIALIVVAILELFGILDHFNVLKISGGVVMHLLDTIKNICICIVIGICGYQFVSGKKKGWIITYWVCLVAVVTCTVLLWI